MKKILIALDYEPSAEKVAEAGYAIAVAMNAEVAIIHVITAPGYNTEHLPFMGLHHGHTTGIAAVVRDIRKEAQNFLIASAQHLGDNSITTTVLEGVATAEILKFCDNWQADLIVMGAHRHHGLDKLFMTHVSRRVFAESRIPVLTVPTGDVYPHGN